MRRAKARERLPSCYEPPSFHPKTTCWKDGLVPFNTSAPFRLLPIRASTSEKLRTSSWLAPSFSHRPTLRPTGEEDARCVEPTSATHTNYVHPHLARSRLASLVTQRGRPTETKAPYDTIGGPSVSRHSKTASADRRCVLTSSSIPSRAGDTSVGVFFPRHTGDRASDTPVANPSLHPQRFVELPRRCLLLCLGRSPAFLRVRADRRMRRPAKTTVSTVS